MINPRRFAEKYLFTILGDRKGFHILDLDEELQEEIIEELKELIEERDEEHIRICNQQQETIYKL